MRLTVRIPLLLTITAVLAACTTTDQPTVAEVPEIRPGILQGYLPMDAPLDSHAFVPPPPEPGSPEQAADDAFSQTLLPLQGTARWELAKSDAHLGFPDAANTFACALGIQPSETATPNLYMVLRRTLADLGLATYGAKNAYQRARPFMVNEQPTCTPEDEEELRTDGSYPSGHTAIGWGWALILSELAPDRAEQLLARGVAFGESRNVCNVHWRSDVQAGMMVGAAAYARLQNNAEFNTAMTAARDEIAKAGKNALSPDLDCAAEAAALAAGS